MTTDQLLTAAANVTKSSAETLSTLSMARLEAVQKLAELNLQTMRTALEQAAQASREMLSSNNPQDWFALPLHAYSGERDR